MKDEDKIRERVELLLDNRQIFLVFLASAVILALVFSLGVVVGKRSAPVPVSTLPTDPLALLDKMSRGPDENLTFHNALTNGVEQIKLGGTAGDRSGDAREEVKADIPVEAVKKAQARTDPGPAKDKPAAPEKKAKARSAPADEVGDLEDKAEFTLQLSAFQERHEAEQFMLKIKQDGLKPFLVTTAIPGRGIWYRVRVGSYTTWEKAMAAKEDFEQRHKIIAYVARK